MTTARPEPWCSSTGQGCDAEQDNLQEGKFTCSGNPFNAQPVQITSAEATADPSAESIRVGDFVTLTAVGGKFGAQTDLEIRQGGAALQNLSIHTSCSKPLLRENRFGSLVLQVFIPETGQGGMGGMGGGGMGLYKVKKHSRHHKLKGARANTSTADGNP